MKNLFVLYFSILKRHARSPLLPAALEGISHFAHLINTDMFRDLLAVLRQIIQDQHADDNADEQADISVDPVGTSQRVRGRLLAIVTAFDVLSGQGTFHFPLPLCMLTPSLGEALNIDLGDFINALFGLLRPLALDTGIEDPPSTFSTDSAPADRPLQRGPAPPKVAVRLLPTSALVFRCLHSIFFSRHALSASAPPARAAAFAKRLAECSLLFPPDTAKQALDFARSLMVREPKLEAMLDTEERTYDGMYKPEMDDPQLVNAFATSLCELEILSTRHWDRRVRTEATKLRDGNLV